jgi:hypothetical protein
VVNRPCPSSWPLFALPSNARESPKSVPLRLALKVTSSVCCPKASIIHFPSGTGHFAVPVGESGALCYKLEGRDFDSR